MNSRLANDNGTDQSRTPHNHQYIKCVASHYITDRNLTASFQRRHKTGHKLRQRRPKGHYRQAYHHFSHVEPPRQTGRPVRQLVGTEQYKRDTDYK